MTDDDLRALAPQLRDFYRDNLDVGELLARECLGERACLTVPFMKDIVEGLVAFRTEHGGRMIYIHKKKSADEKARLLGNALRSGLTISQAIAKVGVSRATGYRLLKRRLPK